MPKLEADIANLNYLLPDTRKVFRWLAEFPEMGEFTFVGGSALAIYLRHRLSEDLDFFTAAPTLPREKLFANILSGKNIRILNDSGNQLDILIDGTRVTFFANNWDKISDSELFYENIRIGTFTLLMSMKVNTLFLRAKFRDYYDLYCISKRGVSLAEMFETSREYLPPLNEKMFQMAIGYADDIVDDKIIHLKPMYSVSAKEIARYFQQKVDTWIKNG